MHESGEESNNASHYSGGAVDSPPAEGGAAQGKAHQVLSGYLKPDPRMRTYRAPETSNIAGAIDTECQLNLVTVPLVGKYV
jgi:hypothetical protein